MTTETFNKLLDEVEKMGFDEVKIIQVKGHYKVYADGKFFCSADSYIEAVNELYKVYK